MARFYRSDGLMVIQQQCLSTEANNRNLN